MKIRRLPPYIIGICTGFLMSKTGGLSDPMWWLTPVIAGSLIGAIDNKLAEIEAREKKQAEWLPEERGEVQKACTQCKGKMVVEVGQSIDSSGKKQRMMTTCPSCAGTGWRKAI